MMRAHIQPVILSGGSGDRLWPLSTRAMPKQFHALVNTGQSMLQATALRVSPTNGFVAPTIVCHEDQRFLVAEQMRASGISPKRILLEPYRKNTAPAITLAAIEAEREGNAYILVLPADHAIDDDAAFLATLEAGFKAADNGKHCVLFGIHPAFAHTGYGYIKIEQGDVISAFTEKPDKATAEGFVADGHYYWNSGIFLLPVAKFLADMDQSIVTTVRAAFDAGHEDLSFFRPDAALYESLPSISIDHAYFEKAAGARLVPAQFTWSDIGDWNAVHDITAQDSDGNAALGNTALLNVRGSYIRTDGPLIAAADLDNHVVVAEKGAIMIARRDQAQNVRQLVAMLATQNRLDNPDAAITRRPWGHFRDVFHMPGCRILNMVIDAGGKLSLQSHAHRHEHWVVVRGVATLTIRDASGLETKTVLNAGDSGNAPMGAIHRLENSGLDPLAVIEVQTGSLLRDDDIIRYDHVY